jgi:hypothetical protein
MQSEGMLSFDENGHHKPTSKHNKAAHKSGPYQLNRVNSLQSTNSAGNRSVDDLLPASTKSASDCRNSNSPASMAAQDNRKTRSEAASPLMNGSTPFTQLNGQLPPLDLSAIEYPAYVPNSADFFGNISNDEPPIFSAGLSATPIDWSHYDFAGTSNAAANEFAPSSYSQPQSFGGFDFSGSEQLPTLTTNTSTSGEVSEVEDLLPNSLEEFEVNNGYRNSTASSTFDLTATQASLLGSTDLSGLDYDEFKCMKTGADASKFLPITSASLAAEESSFVPATLSALNGYSTSLDEDPSYWMDNFGHTMPNMGDLADPDPDPTMAGFWGTQ